MAKGGERCHLCVSVFAHLSAQVAFVLSEGHGVVDSKREEEAMSDKTPDQRVDHLISGSDMTRGH